MDFIYVRNFNCILFWVTILAIIFATATSLTTDHEGEDNLNPNLTEEDETEFDTSNVPSLYSLRLNPKYYGTFQHLMNKRIKGSEFLESQNSFDIYGSQNPKRYSEFLGGPGKRFSESITGIGKRRVVMGGTLTPGYFFAKKLSEYLNSSFKRPVRFSTRGLLDLMSPRGSEFLGGPGK